LILTLPLVEHHAFEFSVCMEAEINGYNVEDKTENGQDHCEGV
jgi:hypothetical protein